MSNSNNLGDKNTYISFKLGIQDFGCGIAEEQKKNLFINFKTLNSNKERNPQGRGLGLSICKNIVETMGGSVEVQSKVGEGSTFIMTFKVMCQMKEEDSCRDDNSPSSPLNRNRHQLN